MAKGFVLLEREMSIIWAEHTVGCEGRGANIEFRYVPNRAQIRMLFMLIANKKLYDKGKHKICLPLDKNVSFVSWSKDTF